MADGILAAGVLLVAVATGALAGLWWGVLLVGIVMIVYAIADTREQLAAARPSPDTARDALERRQQP